MTDKNGFFSFTTLIPGSYPLSIAMIGYVPRLDSLHIRVEGTHDVEVRLSRKPVELPPLTVTARSRWLEVNGMYDRRAQGYNVKVITAEDIERNHRLTLTDALNGIQGSRIVKRGALRRIYRMSREVSDQGTPILMSRDKLPGCEPALFIDGRRHQDRLRPDPGGITIDDWDVIPVLAIEAIEVYTHGTPLEYPHPCGAVLIWTKR